MRVAVAMGLPWLGQNPSNSELVGPAWTLAEKVAEILGVKITPVFTTWDALLPGALADKFDISVAATYDTPERRAVVDFVNWSESGLCFSVLKASGLKTIDDLNSPNVKMVIGMGTVLSKPPGQRFLRRISKSDRRPGSWSELMRFLP